MATENNSKASFNDGKKRKRRYLPHNKAVKKKGPTPLKPGIQGFFITCDGGREHQACHEAINVIESFFEELVSGKNSSANKAAKSEKPLNKKITFTYSDSSDSEDGDDSDEEVEEDKQAEKPAEDGANNGSTVEEHSDPSKKDDCLREAETEQAAGDGEEVRKQTDEKSKVDDETPEENGSTVEGNSDAAKKDDQLHEAGSEQVVGDDVEVGKQTEEKSKVDEEPPEKKQCCDNKRSESKNHSVETSVDKLIEAELKELGDKSKRRFFKLDSGCNGVIFIQMRRRDGDPSPTDIVKHMMESASATKKHMSRFLLRVLPVELSCYASDEEITRAIKPLIEQYFPVNTDIPVKFAVQYDARANSGVERMKIIDAVAKSVPGPHKVDLKNPEKTIMVQIVKTVCLIGVVEKYKELAKYNLRQLTS